MNKPRNNTTIGPVTIDSNQEVGLKKFITKFQEIWIIYWIKIVTKESLCLDKNILDKNCHQGITKIG